MTEHSQFPHTTLSNNRIMIIPTLPTIDSITVQDRTVSFKLRLKYSLNIQKPESLTCDNIKLPAPMDRTIKFGFTPVATTNGATMPAAVSPATVAEPTATRTAMAISQPNNKG